MKLLTLAQAQAFSRLGRQDTPDPVLVAKWFAPWGAATWYGTALTLQTDDAQVDAEHFSPEQLREIVAHPERGVCFGYVTGLGCDEWGYFSLGELFAVRGRFGLGIERDLHWRPRRVSALGRGGLAGLTSL